MADAAAALAPGLKAGAIISDVGSSKAGVADALAKALRDHIVIPAHPVAWTENSGPAAGFASMFDGRWCLVTPVAVASDRSEARSAGKQLVLSCSSLSMPVP